MSLVYYTLDYKNKADDDIQNKSKTFYWLIKSVIRKTNKKDNLFLTLV